MWFSPWRHVIVADGATDVLEPLRLFFGNVRDRLVNPEVTEADFVPRLTDLWGRDERHSKSLP